MPSERDFARRLPSDDLSPLESASIFVLVNTANDVRLEFDAAHAVAAEWLRYGHHVAKSAVKRRKAASGDHETDTERRIGGNVIAISFCGSSSDVVESSQELARATER